MSVSVLPIKSSEAYPWLLEKHYARRICPISYAFGLYAEGDLVGVVTYGQPASPYLCFGVCGDEYRSFVIEHNRLVVDSDIRNASSILVGRSLKMLPKPMIVVSYADTAMGHIGYTYQSTNFIFTGTTKERTDMASAGGGHSRHNSGNSNERQFRSAKHRYVYFCGSKTQKKKMLEALNYTQQPYPKGDSSRYDAGGLVETQRILFA
jgi:hypothetical protein